MKVFCLLSVPKLDRDECDEPSFCGKHATCHNTAGDYFCICDAGFRLNSGETNFTDTSELCQSRSFQTVHILTFLNNVGSLFKMLF